MPVWGDRYSHDDIRAAEYYVDMPYHDTELFVQNRIGALVAYLTTIQTK